MTQLVSNPGPPSSRGDTLFRWLCQSAGGFVLAVAAALVVVLVHESWPVLTNPSQYRLLTSTNWYPDRDSFGALVFVYGTVVTSLIAMLIAVPLGVGAAAYLSELAPPRLRKTCAFLLELLAAIPSVVYGFWAREFLAKQGLAPLFSVMGLPNVAAGQGILAAGLVLAVMILPYITAVSFDVMQAVPRSQREGALSLGSTRWQTIWRVVLALRPTGHHRRVFPRARPRDRRDDGRDDGDRELAVPGFPHQRHRRHDPERDREGTLRSRRDEEGRAGRARPPADDDHARDERRGPAHHSLDGEAAGSHEPGDSPRGSSGGATAAERCGSVSEPRAAARKDRAMRVVLALCQFLTVVPLFLILGYIAVRGAGGIDWDFFTKLPNDSPGRGLAHAFVGSFILVGLATAFAVPVGILAAVFLAEYRNYRMVAPVRFVAELLGGVPSIVIGIFGYALLVYPFWMKVERGFFSAWAGAFALGVMMLPVVIRAGEEAMRLVPNSLARGELRARRESMADGAQGGVAGGAAGDHHRCVPRGRPRRRRNSPADSDCTRVAVHAALAVRPDAVVPYYIYEFSKYAPGSDEIRLAWAAAFVLVVVVFLLNVGVRLIAGKRVVAAARAD